MKMQMTRYEDLLPPPSMMDVKLYTDTETLQNDYKKIQDEINELRVDLLYKEFQLSALKNIHIPQCVEQYIEAIREHLVENKNARNHCVIRYNFPSIFNHIFREYNPANIYRGTKGTVTQFTSDFINAFQPMVDTFKIIKYYVEEYPKREEDIYTTEMFFVIHIQWK